MDTTVTLKMSVSEFDLVREALEGHLAHMEGMAANREQVTPAGRASYRKAAKQTQILIDEFEGNSP
jgi:hypothetical protein